MDDATDSKLCKLTSPDDAVSLLEGRGKASLQSLLVLLEKPKSGNVSDLALRVAEHVGNGSKIATELGAETVLGYLATRPALLIESWGVAKKVVVFCTCSGWDRDT